MAYHPQSDGQTERVNQCLETFLRCFVHACPKKWKEWLSLAEFWYNTGLHCALGVTPFEVLYGHKPRHFGLCEQAALPLGHLGTWLAERETMSKLIQQHLARAQKRMKKQVDKNRIERSFEVNDKVFLKLQPYMQSSVAAKANQKLAFKYFGPFQILEKVGAVAYKLALPSSSMIHPVFHVSQLKAMVPRKVRVSTSRPGVMDATQIPLHVIARLTITRVGTMVAQVRIRQFGLAPDLATWEDEEVLKIRFPRAPAWGQAGSEGEGDVSTTVPDKEDPPSQAVKGGKRERSRRLHRANMRPSGPEWATNRKEN